MALDWNPALFQVAAQVRLDWARPAAQTAASAPSWPLRFKKILRGLFMINSDSSSEIAERRVAAFLE
jgi:hypothetical protein